MIELLKQMLVPGGLLSIFAVWWTTSRTGKGTEKTEVSKQREAESKQIVAASGVEERWQAMHDRAMRDFETQLSEIRAELAEERKQNEAFRSQREADARTIQILYGYGHRVRAQVTALGATPHPWPTSVDPDTL